LYDVIRFGMIWALGRMSNVSQIMGPSVPALVFLLLNPENGGSSMFGIRTFSFPSLALFLFFISQTSFVSAGEMKFLLFSSEKCSACAKIKPRIDAFRENSWPISYIDADHDVELVKRFQIQTLPTFVMLIDDTEFDRLVGESDPDLMQKKIIELCNKGREYLQRGGAGQFTQTAPGPSAGTQSPALSSAGTQPPAPLIAASVRIRVDDPTGLSTGTGTIIDTRGGDALVLTCGHIFRELLGRGPIELDLFLDNGVVHVQGECIDFDLENDLGFVKFTVPPNTVIRAIPLASKDSLQTGQNLLSVGCDGGAGPTIRQHRIISLDRCSTPPHYRHPFHYIQVSGAPTVGRSGGGLFSNEGDLIGVCNTGDPNSNDGHFVPISVVRSQMDRLGYTVFYQSPQLSSQPDRPEKGAAESPEISLASLGGSTAETTPAHSSSSLTPEERATIEEIRRRQAEGAEVILIVNPVKQGNEKPQSEIIKLESVSAKFLDVLLGKDGASAQSKNPHPTLTEQATVMNRRPIAAQPGNDKRQQETGLRTQKNVR